jgi:hypothetical protein
MLAMAALLAHDKVHADRAKLAHGIFAACLDRLIRTAAGYTAPLPALYFAAELPADFPDCDQPAAAPGDTKRASPQSEDADADEFEAPSAAAGRKRKRKDDAADKSQAARKKARSDAPAAPSSGSGSAAAAAATAASMSLTPSDSAAAVWKDDALVRSVALLLKAVLKLPPSQGRLARRVFEYLRVLVGGTGNGSTQVRRLLFEPLLFAH